MYSCLFGGFGGVVITPLVVNAAPTASTAPTASDATISARRDKAFLLWASGAMR